MPGSWYSPRPNYPQSEKATSQDSLSSRDPLQVPAGRGCPVRGVGGPRGPGSKGGRGPGSWCSLACRGSRSMGNHEPGTPHEPGALACCHINTSRMSLGKTQQVFADPFSVSLARISLASSRLPSTGSSSCALTTQMRSCSRSSP